MGGKCKSVVLSTKHVIEPGPILGGGVSASIWGLFWGPSLNPRPESGPGAYLEGPSLDLGLFSGLFWGYKPEFGKYLGVLAWILGLEGPILGLEPWSGLISGVLCWVLAYSGSRARLCAYFVGLGLNPGTYFPSVCLDPVALRDLFWGPRLYLGLFWGYETLVGLFWRS